MNDIHNKVKDEITHPFLNFNSCTIEVWEWTDNLIPHFTVHVLTYPLGLKSIHVSKRGTRD